MLSILFCSSAVRVQVSQAYRRIDITSDRSSLTFDARLMFLSFHTGLSFARAAVVSAILARTPCLDEDDGCDFY